MKLYVTEITANSRLDKYLSEQLPKYSRSQLQKLIKNQQIKVNGQTIAPKQVLSTGDLIEIKELSAEVLARPTESVLFGEISIIDEQPDYLIINKPAGLIVHPAQSLFEPALTDWLTKKFPEIKQIGDNQERPGIVHRLDKDVSGLLIIARTEKAFSHFKKLFMGRRLKKIYTAIAHGQVQKDAGVIDFLIERATSGHKMAARPKNQTGKISETHFTVKQRFIHYTLLEILIKTGRTHQIRAHFAAYGNPIVGDNLYGGHLAKVANKKLQTARIYLAATKLEFKDPNGEKKNYELPLPQAFNDLLLKIK